MFTFIKADFTKAALANLVSNNDTKTTILGLAAGALLAAGLDWGKLFHGDSTQLGNAAGVLIAVALGYYTNKKSK